MRAEEQLVQLLLCWPALRGAPRDVRRLVGARLGYEPPGQRLRREMAAELMGDCSRLDRTARAVQFRRKDGTVWVFDHENMLKEKECANEAMIVASLGPLTKKKCRPVAIRPNVLVEKVVSGVGECGLRLGLGENRRRRCFLSYGAASDNFMRVAHFIRTSTLGRLLEACDYSVQCAMSEPFPKLPKEQLRAECAKAHIRIDEFVDRVVEGKDLIAKLDSAGVLRRWGPTAWVEGLYFTDKSGKFFICEAERLTWEATWAAHLLARKDEYDLFILADDTRLERLVTLFALIGECDLACRIRRSVVEISPGPYMAWSKCKTRNYAGVRDVVSFCLQRRKITAAPLDDDQPRRTAVARILETFELLSVAREDPEKKDAEPDWEAVILALNLVDLPHCVYEALMEADVSLFAARLVHLADVTRNYLRRHPEPHGHVTWKLLGCIRKVIGEAINILDI